MGWDVYLICQKIALYYFLYIKGQWEDGSAGPSYVILLIKVIDPGSIRFREVAEEIMMGDEGLLENLDIILPKVPWFMSSVVNVGEGTFITVTTIPPPQFIKYLALYGGGQEIAVWQRVSSDV